MNVRHPNRPLAPLIALLAPFALFGCKSEHVMEQVTSTTIAAAEGGTAKSHDGKLSLTFAPGALAEDTEIRIETVAGLTDPELVTEAYELGPDGLTFEGDVEIVIDAAGATEELEVVNLDGEAPVALAGSVHDLEAGVIRAPLEHFSAYGGRPRYRPCAGLSCGDTCSPCNPRRPGCSPNGNFACNWAGACVGAQATMCSSPDAGGFPDATALLVFDEVETNDTPAQANVPPTPTPAQPIVTIHGGLFSPNDRDTFQITVPSGNYRLDAFTYGVFGASPVCGGIDTVLFLLDRAGNELARNDDGGDGLCSLVSEILSGGTYYLQVGSFVSPISDYYLDYTLTPIGATPDAGTPPDAGFPDAQVFDSGVVVGHDAGFGFDAGTGSSFVESEPNDARATATAMFVNPMGPVTLSAAIGGAGDVDFFVVQAQAPGQMVRAHTYSDAFQPTSCNGIDTRLFAYDGQGTLIASNDDISTQNRCSEVIVPAAGTIYIEVRGFVGTTPRYYLDFELQ